MYSVGFLFNWRPIESQLLGLVCEHLSHSKNRRAGKPPNFPLRLPSQVTCVVSPSLDPESESVSHCDCVCVLQQFSIVSFTSMCVTLFPFFHNFLFMVVGRTGLIVWDYLGEYNPSFPRS